MSRLDEISELGNNAVVRRISTMLREEGFDGTDFECGPMDRDCGPDNCIAGETLSLDETMREHQADDRRRSFFLDPEENAIAAFVDYYSGRLDSLELRNPEWKYDIENLQHRAIDVARKSVPAITINHALIDSKKLAASALRQLADTIEQETLNDEEVFGINRSGCSRETKVIGTRWTDNGKTLQTRYQVVERCCKKDGCCSNVTCTTRVVNDYWQNTWQDSDVGNPPPANPPSFENEPWNNRAPFFSDPNVGTLTSDFGWRTVNGQPDFHPGIDVAVSPGTPVQSLHSGTVTLISGSGANNGVHIRSGNNLYVYMHITPHSDLQNGAQIQVGQTLGEVISWPDNPNRSHLHHAQYSPAVQTDSNAHNPLP